MRSRRTCRSIAQDTGPTDFHLHLPPGGYQLVLVTSGVFTFDYDGRLYYVGPGAVMLQSAIVHRQLFYTWSGLSTEENLKTPQTVVPDPMSMGYSGKFLEAFITDPTTFPNPTVVGPDQINEAETPRVAWSHSLHDRPEGCRASGFRIPWNWMRCYKPLTADAIGQIIHRRLRARHRNRGSERSPRHRPHHRDRSARPIALCPSSAGRQRIASSRQR
jgi:hypothetical protein